MNTLNVTNCLHVNVEVSDSNGTIPAGTWVEPTSKPVPFEINLPDTVTITPSDGSTGSPRGCKAEWGVHRCFVDYNQNGYWQFTVHPPEIDGEPTGDTNVTVGTNQNCG
jgi:hypothetical protein